MSDTTERERLCSDKQWDVLEAVASASTNPWSTLATRLIYENPWIRVREDKVIRPDGQKGIYGVVHFRNKAVGVLPVDENGDVWLVGQYRYPLERYSWEIPEGGCPDGESPEACASRELMEETGLLAERLERAITAHLSNSVSDEWGVVFRATGLEPGPRAPDGCEQIEVHRVPFEVALASVERGEITDSLSVIAILHEAVRRLRGSSGQPSAEPPVPPPTRAYSLISLALPLAIVRLDAWAEIPLWAMSGPFWSATRTSEETSVVVAAERVPPNVEAARGWRALRVGGPFDLSETGILAALTGLLASRALPIFAVSTFETDYLLVRETDLVSALQSLRSAGHAIQEQELPRG